MDYKSPSTTPPTGDASFPDEPNGFYAHFDRDNQLAAIKAVLTTDPQPLTLSALSRTSAHKAAGPDGIPGGVLRACPGQLAEVLTEIFNLSLNQAAVPSASKPSLTTSALLHSPITHHHEVL